MRCVGMLSPTLRVVGLGPRLRRSNGTLSVQNLHPHAERGDEEKRLLAAV